LAERETNSVACGIFAMFCVIVYFVNNSPTYFEYEKAKTEKADMQ